jgi:hypothetical protein
MKIFLLAVLLFFIASLQYTEALFACFKKSKSKDSPKNEARKMEKVEEDKSTIKKPLNKKKSGCFGFCQSSSSVDVKDHEVLQERALKNLQERHQLQIEAAKKQAANAGTGVGTGAAELEIEIGTGDE